MNLFETRPLAAFMFVNNVANEFQELKAIVSSEENVIV